MPLLRLASHGLTRCRRHHAFRHGCKAPESPQRWRTCLAPLIQIQSNVLRSNSAHITSRDAVLISLGYRVLGRSPASSMPFIKILGTVCREDDCDAAKSTRGSAANVLRIASRGTSTVTPHSCTVRVSCGQLRRMVSVQKTVPRTRSNHKLAPSAHSAKPLQSSSNHVHPHDKAMPGSTRYPGSCGLPQGPAESSVPCYEGKPTRLISS